MRNLDYINMDALSCQWDTAPWLLFSNEVEPLVYYSHLFPALAILTLAGVVFIRSHKKLTNKLFLLLAVLFALFAVFDLILWATEKPSLIMFFWSMLTYLEPLIYATTLLFVLSFIYRGSPRLYESALIATLLLPVVILGPTPLNIAGFDYTNCWRLAVEGPLLYYVYLTELVFVTWIIAAVTKAISNTTDQARKRTLRFMLFGVIAFLLAFSSGNIFGTLLQSVLGEEAWIIGQYGFFGLPVFLGIVTYLMVQYEIFAARMIYAEALLIGSFVTLLSLLFIPDMQTARPIIALTLGLFTILGSFLLIGIRRDIQQRQQIEKLASNLERANIRLKALDKQKSEFVSIASHQLRSPITAIRGYASLLLEGSYGTMPVKAKEPIERIEKSSRLMASSIEDYLNVSRIESGNMKYNLSDFNLKDEVEHLCDDLRADAIKHGLVLLFKSNLNSHSIIHADLGKTVQIVQNLINNSIKYTEKGSITVLVRDDVTRKKIYIDVTDTGIGMNDETLNTIFQKFERADNANSIDVHGTGLGLYVAKMMAEAMGGNVTAHSEGDGKGSRFTLEMPLAL